MRTRPTSDTPIATAVDVTGRLLSTTLHALSTGAAWGARLVDEQRARLDTDRVVSPRHKRVEVVHYVTGEICCVLVARGLTGPHVRQFYDLLWESLNESVTQLVKDALGESRTRRSLTSFGQDMAPTVLARLTREGKVRRYVGALARRATGEQDEPFVLLEQTGDQGSSLLAYCDAARVEATARERQACIRELVNLVNSNLERVNRDLARFLKRSQGNVRAARLEAVTPNWLAAGTQDHFTDAGPGAAPGAVSTPLSREETTLRFERALSHPPGFPMLDSLVQAGRDQAERGASSGVLVAILDTCPKLEQVKTMASAHPENTLLQELLDPLKVRLGEAPSINSVALSGILTDPHGRPIRVNWQHHLTHPGMSDDDYLMADHGIFAAGIVRDVAPAASIRVIRVLNDFGIGDLFSLTRVMSELPNLLGKDGIEKIVVNLSLVVDLPTDSELLDWWFPRTSRDPVALKQRFGDVCRVIDMMHLSLHRTLTWLTGSNRNVLVVAAAGNDFRPAAGANRPSPRWPARYDGALGVAAVDSRGNPSRYSNKGDFVTFGNGVATFGGDASAVGAGNLPGTADPMVGLFTAPEFPLMVPPAPAALNTTGWARWAGTSFATPVVSALAASIWASEAGSHLSPRALIEAVGGYATSSGSDLDCPVIPAYQKLPAQP